MDFECTYYSRVWRVGDHKEREDYAVIALLPHEIFQKTCHLMFDLHQSNSVDHLASSFIRKLFHHHQQNFSSLQARVQEQLTAVPLQQQLTVIDKIKDFANSLLQDSANPRHRAIQICICFVIERRINISKSTFEGLERVRIEGCLVEIECVICFEKFDNGEEITRLPCYHLFHGDCISKWLQRSITCPLCRYSLPVN
ncbi:hypothetical protein Pint_08120 [Pistacia integerrima]|uniref:Uncharacterized protein n=1 Tax=Pistacia integerrima TaxID=434235 RepID=A0ACC0XX39_9ROSI|nr:hypothetical protein Pint_08120 [Pistacia integerrima]